MSKIIFLNDIRNLNTWISVIFLNPISSIAFNVNSETFPSSEEKDVSLRIPAPRDDPGTAKIDKNLLSLIYSMEN